MKPLQFLTLAILMLNASLGLKADLLAPTTNTLPSRIAVLDSSEAGLMSLGLADLVEAGLQKEGVATYDRRFVRTWLGERELNRFGVMDFKTLNQARFPGVDFFVRAEVRASGSNQFSLTLEASRAADAVAVISLNASGLYPQEWIPTLDRLIHEMALKLQAMQPNPGKQSFARTLTWMPEASLWFFRGMDCYADGDYAQAAVAFRRARRWEDHFRPAWLWEARCYRQMGMASQAARILEAAHLSEKPVIPTALRPIFTVSANKGISTKEKDEFARRLADSGQMELLDPRWIGASTREVDLQLTGEMSARSTPGNAWLMLDELVLLDRNRDANGREIFRARRQNVLTGEILTETEAPDSTNGLDELARRLLDAKQKTISHEDNTGSPRLNTNSSPSILPFNDAERELVRCLKRVWQHPADTRALLAAADSCRTWESDVIDHGGKSERGVEWRIREEFLKQAVDSIQRNPSLPDASFLLASALWRQRYTPEYTIWAGSFSNIPLREQMKPLLDLFPQNADAMNLSERITENAVHNRRSVPVDNRYWEALFPAEAKSMDTKSPSAAPPDAEERKQVFVSAFYQGQMEQALAAYFGLTTNRIAPPSYEQNLFLDKMLQGRTVPPGFISQLEGIIQTPEVPGEMRFPAAYQLALWFYKNGDYFQATEFLRELVNDDASAEMVVSWGGSNGSTSIADQAYDLLKQVRLFNDGQVNFNECCGRAQSLPEPEASSMAALENLFQQRMALTSMVGRPTAERLDRNRQEMRRLEEAMVSQYRNELPAFLQRKIQQAGPSPETMGLCASLGTNALPLLPQIVDAVCHSGNPSTKLNALSALSGMGKSAAAALPVVILATADQNVIGVQPAAQRTLKRLGTAPRKSVPYLARLLYHANPTVAMKAAEAVSVSASLPDDLQSGLDDDELISKIRYWWENTGSWQSWE